MSGYDKALWTVGDFHTYVAEGAITVGQAVRLGTANRQIEPTDATDDLCIGFAYDNAASGAEILVCSPFHIAAAKAGGTVTRGSYVMPQEGVGLEGSVVVIETGGTVVGLALDSGTVGQLCRVLMTPGFNVAG